MRGPAHPCDLAPEAQAPRRTHAAASLGARVPVCVGLPGVNDAMLGVRHEVS
jgi:hypothetical protein